MTFWWFISYLRYVEKGGAKPSNFKVLSINTNSCFVFESIGTMQGQAINFKSSSIQDLYTKNLYNNENGVKSAIFRGASKTVPRCYSGTCQTLSRLFHPWTSQLKYALQKVISPPSDYPTFDSKFLYILLYDLAKLDYTTKSTKNLMNLKS